MEKSKIELSDKTCDAMRKLVTGFAKSRKKPKKLGVFEPCICGWQGYFTISPDPCVIRCPKCNRRGPEAADKKRAIKGWNTETNYRWSLDILRNQHCHLSQGN